MFNEMNIRFISKRNNIVVIRNMISAMIVEYNPTITFLNELKTVISEAITNSIVHGYHDKDGTITLIVGLKGKTIDITIIDSGVGILDIDKARQPFFTTRANDERSGMGFTLMESFMDRIDVYNNLPSGLTVNMLKEIQ